MLLPQLNPTKADQQFKTTKHNPDRAGNQNLRLEREIDLQRRRTEFQMSLGENHGIERLPPLPEEEDPQGIIRHQGSPRLREHAHPRRVFRPHRS